MEKEKDEIKKELFEIIEGIEDFSILKYLLIFIKGKLKVG